MQWQEPSPKDIHDITAELQQRRADELAWLSTRDLLALGPTLGRILWLARELHLSTGLHLLTELGLAPQ